MNGQLDLSLLPSFFFDQATVFTGGSSDRFGSGALGGIISLRGSAQTKETAFLSLGTELGSFSRLQFQADAGIRKKDFALRLRAYDSKAKNNYSYVNRGLVNSPTETLQHAAAKQRGLLLDLDYQLAKDQILSIHYWKQYNFRELPPTMLESSSEATQEDQSDRLVAEWNKKAQSGDYTLRAAFLQNILVYNNPIIFLESKSLSFGAIQDFEWSKKVKENLWFVSVQNTFYSASQNAYGPKKEQSRQAADISWNRSFGKFRSRLAFRQEVLNYSLTPFGAAAGMEVEANKHWTFRGQVAKVYRIPNFNDLYWVPGGNPDIQSEEGYTGEIGTNYKWVNQKKAFEAKATVFASLIDNWIIWLPRQGIWTAQNLKKVLSRGAEYQARYIKINKGWNWSLIYNGSFTMAENIEASTPGDASVGKQLIYVPFWKNTINAELNFRKWNILYSHIFNGGVYTSSDNSSFIRPWQTGNLRITYSLKIKKQEFQAQAGIENIGNTRYEVIEWRPMPGRWYKLGIQWKISK